jgi:hypothetical protein
MIKKLEHIAEESDSYFKGDDALFWNLSKLLRRNYENNYRVEQGDENKEKGIVGVLLSTHEDGIRLVDDTPVFEDYGNMNGVLEEITRISKKDGAHLWRGNSELSRKVMFAYVKKLTEKFGIDESGITRLLKRYVPYDFSKVGGTTEEDIEIGAKTKAAIATALVGKNGDCYFLKQTVYDGTSIGKLCKFGKQGLEYELFAIKTENKFAADFYLDQEESVVLTFKTYQFNDKKQRVEKTGEYLVKPRDLLDYWSGNVRQMHLYDVEANREQSIRELLAESVREITRTYDLKAAS